MKKRIAAFCIFFLASFPVFAVKNIDFVDVGELDPGIVLDIRYATANNFTGQAIYPVARCLLRRDAALRLLKVEQNIEKQGYRLIVFDCYRPLRAQKRFWEIMPDERYVADPSKGSRHNRGAAVDVGLADSAGRPLPMPSAYDEFSQKSHRGWKGASSEALKNSAILEAAMKSEGFEPFPTEWWHFDAPGWEEYPVSDFPLKKTGGC
ncbi:MAG: D-alanyl-D-alanine dipeptidase, partial [Chlorobiaceae bacterium]|nr:D-alanyl-D-alanine dipeptidase [Chlorobiaceae bacterium]